MGAAFIMLFLLVNNFNKGIAGNFFILKPDVFAGRNFVKELFTLDTVYKVFALSAVFVCVLECDIAVL